MDIEEYRRWLRQLQTQAKYLKYEISGYELLLDKVSTILNKFDIKEVNYDDEIGVLVLELVRYKGKLSDLQKVYENCLLDISHCEFMISFLNRK
jgi:hypothetical protein